MTDVRIVQPTVPSNNQEKGCWKSFTTTLGDEFQVSRFCFNHQPVDVFYKSQWQKSDRSIWYPIYRWLLAAFYVCSCIACGIRCFAAGRFFIFFTNWGYFLCVFATIHGAVLSTLWYLNKVNGMEQYWNVKVFWLTHWSALLLACVISIMYWSLLLRFAREPAGNPYNILLHGTNSLMMLVDHFVVAFPSRILHFIYPVGLGVVYFLFSLIYYFAGGTGLGGTSWIYPILDWGEAPGQACGSVVIAVVCCFVFSFALFWLYKFRVFLYDTFGNLPKPHTMHY